MKLIKLFSGIILTILFTCSLVSANEVSKINAAKSLETLIKGNERFVHLKLKHPDQNLERRMELTKGQHPFAAVLSCSDSRVPPEILFDQGLGDIFVIRVAGNVLDDDVLGSIEYAVEHLGIPLVIVLGHEKCGAVTAAVAGIKEVCHIQSLVKKLQPAIDQAETEKGDLVDNAIRDNVKIDVNSLDHSEPILAELVKTGKVKIVGAYYHLDNGKVEIINP